jgi:hypothetical protein
MVFTQRSLAALFSGAAVLILVHAKSSRVNAGGRLVVDASRGSASAGETAGRWGELLEFRRFNLRTPHHGKN